MTTLHTRIGEVLDDYRSGLLENWEDVVKAIDALLPGWQDIATAPKGREILLFYPPSRPRMGQKEYTSPAMMRVGFVGSTPRSATYWRPLPDPPTPETKPLNHAIRVRPDHGR